MVDGLKLLLMVVILIGFFCVFNWLQSMPVTNSVCAMSDNGLDLDKMNPLGELNFFFGNASVNQSSPLSLLLFSLLITNLCIAIDYSLNELWFSDR